MASPSTSGLTAIVVFECVVIISTFLRVLHRYREKKLWLDEMFIIAAFAINMASTGIMLRVVSVPMLGDFQLFTSFSTSALMFIRYGTPALHAASLWSARIACEISLVRFSVGLFKRVAEMLVVLFGVLCLATIVVNVVSCAAQVGAAQSPVCSLTPMMGYVEMLSGFLADGWLTIGPFCLLRQYPIPRKSHNLVVAVFACSLFISVAGVVRTKYNAEAKEFKATLTSYIQVAVAIIVSNLLVLVPCTYRWLSASASKSADAQSGANPSETV